MGIVHCKSRNYHVHHKSDENTARHQTECVKVLLLILQQVSALNITLSMNTAVCVCTMVLSVGLVEALRVNESQVIGVLRWQQIEWGSAVGHQGVIAIAHSHVALQ